MPYIKFQGDKSLIKPPWLGYIPLLGSGFQVAHQNHVGSFSSIQTPESHLRSTETESLGWWLCELRTLFSDYGKQCFSSLPTVPVETGSHLARPTRNRAENLRAKASPLPLPTWLWPFQGRKLIKASLFSKLTWVGSFLTGKMKHTNQLNPDLQEGGTLTNLHHCNEIRSN